MLCVAWALCLTLAASAKSTLETGRFARPVDCAGQKVLVHQVIKQVTARSRLECAVLCRRDARCQSFFFTHAQNRHCQLSNAVADQDCSNMEPAPPGGKFYQKPDHCFNNGTLNPDGTCLCQDLFCGSVCTRRKRDCKDVFDCGIRENGAYFIQPVRSPVPFYVHCTMMTNKVRTDVLDHSNTSVSFNRTWTEYEAGFGDLLSDHWLGLRYLHYLSSSRKYSLRFVLLMANGTRLYPIYDEFVVNGADTGYSFVARAVPSINLVDCLTPLQGARFSTYDNDNNGYAGANCAAMRGGGWWFSGTQNCSANCNPFGPLLKPVGGLKIGVPGEAFWSLKDAVGNMTPYAVIAFLLNYDGQ